MEHPAGDENVNPGVFFGRFLRELSGSNRLEGGNLLGDFEREGSQVGVEKLAFARGQLFEQLREGRGVAGGESGKACGISYAATETDDLRHSPLSAGRPNVGRGNGGGKVLWQVPVDDELFAKFAVIDAENGAFLVEHAVGGSNVGAEKMDVFLRADDRHGE